MAKDKFNRRIGDTESLKEFKVFVSHTLENHDQHIGELRTGQEALNKKMDAGFESVAKTMKENQTAILDVIKSSTPEYDLMKTFKTVGATLVFGGMLFTSASWLINSQISMQVAVPINAGEKLQEDFKDLENQYKKDKLDLYEYKVKHTAANQRIDDNLKCINEDIATFKKQFRTLEKNQAMNFGREQGKEK